MSREACIDPNCTSLTVDVVDGRDTDRGRRRYKQRRLCGQSWTTLEILASEAEALSTIRAAIKKSDQAKKLRHTRKVSVAAAQKPLLTTGEPVMPHGGAA